jgi:uncharacterized Zn finger protein
MPNIVNVAVESLRTRMLETNSRWHAVIKVHKSLANKETPYAQQLALLLEYYRESAELIHKYLDRA